MRIKPNNSNMHSLLGGVMVVRVFRDVFFPPLTLTHLLPVRLAAKNTLVLMLFCQ